MKPAIVERPLGWSAREGSGQVPRGDDTLDVGRFMAAARRQAPLVALAALVGLAIAMALILATTPRYRAVETVLLDEERAELLDQVSALPNAVRSDSAVQSEVEIIKSQALALQVVDRLDLAADEAFMNPPVDAIDQVVSQAKGLVEPLLELIEPSDPAVPEPSSPEAEESEEQALRYRAAALLRSGLDVRRVGRSFVLEISFTGFDRVRVTRIARAYGDGYTQFQLQTTTEVARGAGEWLRQRLDLLEEQSIEAARAVQDFRVEHGLVSVRGDLLSEQQLSEMTSQLIRAEAETAEMKARLDQFEILLSKGAVQAVAASTLLTESPSDEVLAELRTGYLNALTRRRNVVSKWGEEHPEAVRLAEEMAATEQAIQDELTRAAEGVRAGYEVARSREASLRSNLDTASGDSTTGMAPLGRLRQLEETSETYAEVYRDFLKRFEFAAQQQSFPIAAVQIISRAEMPKGAATPRKGPLLIIGLFLGGIIGAGIGAIRELREQPLRTRRDIHDGLGLDCAGLVPGAARPGKGEKSRELDRTLRAMKLAVDRARTGKGGAAVGIAPILPGNEGHVPEAFAGFLAGQGARVLVVDAAGKVRPDRFAKAMTDEAAGGVEYIGAGDLVAGADGAASSDLQARLAGARETHDYVLYALPPLNDGFVAEGTARALDRTILTVPWGRAGRLLVQGALEENPEFTRRLATTVLTDANLRVARRYMPRGSYEAALSR